MKRDDALKLSEEALSDLAASLEAGRSEVLERYLNFLGGFHRYSFGNVMMIYLQFPRATNVAGFTTWRKLGRQVRKGEKGIAILAPMMRRVKIEDDADEESSARSPKVVRGFKVAHVFDVSQTEGEELPEFAKIIGDPGERLARLRQLVADEGIELRYELIVGGALGRSSGGEITVIPGLPAAEDFSVLVHELAHELLHRDERRLATTKTVRETEAEAVSFVVSRAVGLYCSTRSSDYIQLYAGDVKVLSESLGHIQHAATRILSALEIEPISQRVAAGA